MRALREECLRHFIFVSVGHLWRTVAEVVPYYNGAKVHRGRGASRRRNPELREPGQISVNGNS